VTGIVNLLFYNWKLDNLPTETTFLFRRCLHFNVSVGAECGFTDFPSISPSKCQIRRPTKQRPLASISFLIILHSTLLKQNTSLCKAQSENALNREFRERGIDLTQTIFMKIKLCVLYVICHIYEYAQRVLIQLYSSNRKFPFTRVQGQAEYF
jgi:hypothetical protein